MVSFQKLTFCISDPIKGHLKKEGCQTEKNKIVEDGEKAQTVEMVKRVTVSLTPRAFLALQLVGAQGQETASHEICRKKYIKRSLQSPGSNLCVFSIFAICCAFFVSAGRRERF